MSDEDKPISELGYEKRSEDEQREDADELDDLENSATSTNKVKVDPENDPNKLDRQAKRLKYVLYAMLTGLIGVVVFLFFFASKDAGEPTITSYEECVEAGYPIMESYPEKCAVPDGDTFTRVLTADELVEVADSEDSESVEGCGDLATYTNVDIGFEFCYPTEWGVASFADEEESLASGMGHSISFADNENAGATIRTTDWQTEFGRGGAYFDSPPVFTTDFTPTSDLGEDFVEVSVLIDSQANTLVTAYCSDFLGVIAVDSLVKVGVGDYDVIKFYHLFRVADETGIDFTDCDDLATLVAPISGDMVDVANSFKLI